MNSEVKNLLKARNPSKTKTQSSKSIPETKLTQNYYDDSTIEFSTAVQDAFMVKNELIQQPAKPIPHEAVASKNDDDDIGYGIYADDYSNSDATQNKPEENFLQKIIEENNNDRAKVVTQTPLSSNNPSSIDNKVPTFQGDEVNPPNDPLHKEYEPVINFKYKNLEHQIKDEVIAPLESLFNHIHKKNDGEKWKIFFDGNKKFEGANEIVKKFNKIIKNTNANKKTSKKKSLYGKSGTHDLRDFYRNIMHYNFFNLASDDDRENLFNKLEDVLTLVKKEHSHYHRPENDGDGVFYDIYTGDVVTLSIALSKLRKECMQAELLDIQTRLEKANLPTRITKTKAYHDLKTILDRKQNQPFNNHEEAYQFAQNANIVAQLAYYDDDNEYQKFRDLAIESAKKYILKTTPDVSQMSIVEIIHNPIMTTGEKAIAMSTNHFANIIYILLGFTIITGVILCFFFPPVGFGILLGSSIISTALTAYCHFALPLYHLIRGLPTLTIDTMWRVAYVAILAALVFTTAPVTIPLYGAYLVANTMFTYVGLSAIDLLKLKSTFISFGTTLKNIANETFALKLLAKIYQPISDLWNSWGKNISASFSIDSDEIEMTEGGKIIRKIPSWKEETIKVLKIAGLIALSPLIITTLLPVFVVEVPLRTLSIGIGKVIANAQIIANKMDKITNSMYESAKTFANSSINLINAIFKKGQQGLEEGVKYVNYTIKKFSFTVFSLLKQTINTAASMIINQDKNAMQKNNSTNSLSTKPMINSAANKDKYVNNFVPIFLAATKQYASKCFYAITAILNNAHRAAEKARKGIPAIKYKQKDNRIKKAQIDTYGDNNPVTTTAKKCGSDENQLLNKETRQFERPGMTIQ